MQLKENLKIDEKTKKYIVIDDEGRFPLYNKEKNLIEERKGIVVDSDNNIKGHYFYFNKVLCFDRPDEINDSKCKCGNVRLCILNYKLIYLTYENYIVSKKMFKYKDKSFCFNKCCLSENKIDLYYKNKMYLNHANVFKTAYGLKKKYLD